MKRWRGMFFVLALLGLAGAAGALDVPLRYVESGGTGFSPTGMNEAGKLSAKPPRGLKAPAFTCAHPAYGAIVLAGKSYAFALDCAQKSDKLYDRLIVDLNGNRDLTDDKPIDARGSSAFSAQFEPFSLEIEAGGKKVPYRLSLSVGNYQSVSNDAEGGFADPGKLSVMIDSACWYVGEATLGGATFHVMLSDMNCNGVFGDCYSTKGDGKVSATSNGKQVVYREGDAFILRTDDKMDASEIQIMGKYLVLGNACFEAKVDIAGGKLVLTPVTEGVGTLALPEGTERIEMVAANEKNSVMIDYPAASVPMPAGKYRVFKYEIHKQDGQGDTWRAVVDTTGGQRPGTMPVSVAIAAGKTAALKFGEPFTIRAQSISQGAESAYISMPVTDGAGMNVREFARVAGTKTTTPLYTDNARPAEPTYKIIGAGGKEVASGKFEYG